MLANRHLPPPVNDSRCRACSLIDICQPHALTARDVQLRLRSGLFDPEY
jgi:CRISPR-associated exonuclease Cas4